jgi:K+-transporting ATPase ATPase C chain
MALLRPLLVLTGSLTGLTGLVYPLLVTGVAQVIFPAKARGSLIVRQGRILGSDLIGQHSEDPKHFWGRLSATGGFPTHAANSGGSNLAPSHPDLKARAEARINALREANPGNLAQVPADLVTASGSGLDPHITPAAADYQITRVARIRGLEEARVRQLVKEHTEGRALGLLGESRVNVLRLNLALEELQ